MTTATSYTQLPKEPSWFGRTENWPESLLWLILPLN